MTSIGFFLDCNFLRLTRAGLPDGLFSNQKSQFWLGPWNGICCYVLWPFGTFYGHLVCCTKKNLATLLATCVNRRPTPKQLIFIRWKNIATHNSNSVTQMFEINYRNVTKIARCVFSLHTQYKFSLWSIKGSYSSGFDSRQGVGKVLRNLCIAMLFIVTLFAFQHIRVK
jgi:hypothetical protein